MNRRDLLLAILACSDGRPYSPVQIQKAAFLISRNAPALVNEGPAFEFAPYDYGPFDVAVYGEAEALQREGLALVAPSSFGRWNTYSASETGLGRGRALLASMPASSREYVQKVSEWVRMQSFASLVRSIYDAYPEMKANSVFQG